MKRITALFLLFVLCLSAFSAQGMEARYHAKATVNFHLRESPKESGKRIALINEGSEVIVSEYGNAWSKIIINQKAGYAKSEWLSKFVALDPFADPVPEHQSQIGVAKINTPVLVSVAGYSGNILGKPVYHLFFSQKQPFWPEFAGKPAEYYGTNYAKPLFAQFGDDYIKTPRYVAVRLDAKTGELTEVPVVAMHTNHGAMPSELELIK